MWRRRRTAFRGVLCVACAVTASCGSEPQDATSTAIETRASAPSSTVEAPPLPSSSLSASSGSVSSSVMTADESWSPTFRLPPPTSPSAAPSFLLEGAELFRLPSDARTEESRFYFQEMQLSDGRLLTVQTTDSPAQAGGDLIGTWRFNFVQDVTDGPVAVLTAAGVEVYLAAQFDEHEARDLAVALRPAADGFGWELPAADLILEGVGGGPTVHNLAGADSAGPSVQLKVLVDATDVVSSQARGSEGPGSEVSVVERNGVRYVQRTNDRHSVLAWQSEGGAQVQLFVRPEAADDISSVVDRLRSVSDEAIQALPQQSGDGCFALDC